MTSAFTREPIMFYMMGRQFKYEFIPNIHLNYIVSNVFELAMNVYVESGTLGLREGVKLETVMERVNNLLIQRIYLIISDVLEHQNDAKVSMDDLINKTRPMEMAAFIEMVINDEEIPDAVGVLIEGLGKLQTRLGTKIPSLNQSSMQSFLQSLGKTPTGSTTESPTPE